MTENKVTFKRVLDKDGNHFLWDIYCNGKWKGSKRTFEQARDYGNFLVDKYKNTDYNS